MLERHQPAYAVSETNGRGIVIFLYLGYMLSFGDRVLFGIVMKPAKATLGFTDSQLGLLAGAAFALSYAFFCPIGGLIVDKFNRKAVMVVAITFWSPGSSALSWPSRSCVPASARANRSSGRSPSR